MSIWLRNEDGCNERVKKAKIIEPRQKTKSISDSEENLGNQSHKTSIKYQSITTEEEMQLEKDRRNRKNFKNKRILNYISDIKNHRGEFPREKFLEEIIEFSDGELHVLIPDLLDLIKDTTVIP